MKRPKLARDPRYFSPGGYRRLIQRALRLGYRISGFRNFRALGRRPVLLLRHDLDHSIRAAAIIAEIEAELGVSSTYFVQVACPFYNLLSNESRKLIEHIVQLGHEIGLHYEAPRYEGPGGEYKLGGDLRLLRDLSGQRVSSASQHVPVDASPIDISRFVSREAYQPRFIAAPMAYVSDSLMKWRQVTPHDLLDHRRSFQLLTHPMKWAYPTKTMRTALDRCLREEIRSLRQLYRATDSYYRELLRTRALRDEQFLLRRGLTE